MFLALRWHVLSVEQIILRARESNAEAYDGMDLPEDDFNYEEFVNQEFGSSRRSAIKTVWWITAILVVAAFIAIYFYAAH